MKYVKLTKIGNVSNPYHKNSTFGESKPHHVGICHEDPIVGERYNLYPFEFDGNIYGGISTSIVSKILDNNTFETMNSVYRWEELPSISSIKIL